MNIYFDRITDLWVVQSHQDTTTYFNTFKSEQEAYEYAGVAYQENRLIKDISDEVFYDQPIFKYINNI